MWGPSITGVGHPVMNRSRMLCLELEMTLSREIGLPVQIAKEDHQILY